ncbi:MAG: DUF3426 domain-containing protein [Pseudomonadota bacterium]
MYTQCPSCMTVYLLDAATLGASRGDMRCGKCHAVFCALDALADEPPGDGMITPTFPTATPPHLEPPEPFDPTAREPEVDPAALVYFDLPDTARPAIGTADGEPREASQHDPTKAALRRTQADGTPDAETTQKIEWDDDMRAALRRAQANETPGADTTQEVEWDDDMQAALRRAQVDATPGADTTQEVEWDDDMQAALQGARTDATHDADTTQEVAWDDESQAALQRAASREEETQELEWDDEMLAAFEQVEAAAEEPETDEEPNDDAGAADDWDGVDPDQILAAEAARPAASLEGRSGPWRVMTILLTLVLFGQTLWWGRDELQTNPTTRGWLESACETFGCTLPLRQDVALIRLASRDIRPHPSVEGALIVNATLHNQAEFRQPYPSVQIRLSDLQGNPVAARRFAPEDYLERPGLALDGMPPRTMVPLVFEVVDPGDDAVAFEFDFL